MSKIKPPMIILNFKNYSETIGKKGLELAKIAEAVAKEKEAEIIVCPQTADIRLISSNVEIPVFAQHVDSDEPGSHTGNNLMETLLESGAKGSLVNHSEHRLKLADIDFCVTRAKELNLDHIVCTNNISTSKAAAVFSPNFIAVEPPELIGGDISVTTADPDIVSGSVEAVKDIDKDVKVLCGAGVKNGMDVAKSIELGAEGVLLASGIVKAKDKESVIRDLASGL